MELQETIKQRFNDLTDYIVKSFPRSFKDWGRILAWGSVSFLIIVLLAFTVPLPAIDNFQNRPVPQSTKFYDRTGKVLLYDMHGTMRRTAVPLADISEDMQHAAIAVEDAKFYEHGGVRPESIARALWIDIKAGSFKQGGSTITQQVVKNALLDQRKTPLRKIEEMVLAIRLEWKYTKDEILEVYLNEAPYGGVLYGVEEASQTFFGVSAKNLDLAQAAYIAALPKAPSYYSPYGYHTDELDQRKDFVLGRMKELGYITQEEQDKASKEVVKFQTKTDTTIKAPQFVFYVKQYLDDKYGADKVNTMGLNIITTLDWDLQKRAEEIVARNVQSNTTQFNASNAGMVAIDPKTGQILAMVGSADYDNDTIQGKFNVTLAKRQPGSSFKPFVYATAFQEGYTPETEVFDLRTQFTAACKPEDLTTHDDCYSPTNYDGIEHGPISFRDALAQSINIASVKVEYLAGVKDSILTAEKMGITSLGDANQYGLTLVLGGGEVTLLEMTSAYGAFANKGILNSPIPVLEVRNGLNAVIDSITSSSTAQVIDPKIANTISDVLSDNTARQPAFGEFSPLNFPGYQVAAKTGTTNDYRDAWTIGYTDGIVIGAWAGNNNNKPMVHKISAYIVSPMWHEVMSYALLKYPSTYFAPRDYAINTSLPQVLQGNWNPDESQGIHDILHWVTKSNPLGGPPTDPSSDPQYKLWEYPVKKWADNYIATRPPQGFDEFTACYQQYSQYMLTQEQLNILCPMPTEQNPRPIDGSLPTPIPEPINDRGTDSQDTGPFDDGHLQEGVR